jgi:hypothetical protein
MIPLELRPRLVSLAGPPAPGLSPGTAPLATAPEQLLLALALRHTLRPRRPHASIITTHALPVNDWAVLIVFIFDDYRSLYADQEIQLCNDTCPESVTFIRRRWRRREQRQGMHRPTALRCGWIAREAHRRATGQ